MLKKEYKLGTSLEGPPELLMVKIFIFELRFYIHWIVLITLVLVLSLETEMGKSDETSVYIQI